MIVDIGKRIGTTIYDISIKSIKNPRNIIINIDNIKKPHLSPGRVVMNASTISSAPLYINTIEKAVAPMRMANTMDVVFTVSNDASLIIV